MLQKFPLNLLLWIVIPLGLSLAVYTISHAPPCYPNKANVMLLKVAGEDKNCLLLVIQDDIVQVMRMQPCDGKPTKEEAQ